ncbi:hypothetical protein BGZ70_001377 [Mortierella alpina]|uniref:Uncharacterized protein n=1 Tax=Mortierella alpina TaxID=64518 RepID=A0A9P6JC42_MORAP|nr:hypothetical protein BGZ70_001377 [Mortierella alpina]
MSLSDRLSEMISFAELDKYHQPWSSSAPEGQITMPAAEVLTEEAAMIHPAVGLTQHTDQASYYPEAETATPQCYAQYSEPVSAFNGLQHTTFATQDPYGPIYYEYDALGGTFYQPHQDPAMDMAAQWPIQGAAPLTLSQQPSQSFVEMTEHIDDDAVDYSTPLYALTAQSSAPSQPRFRWRPHRLY